MSQVRRKSGVIQDEPMALVLSLGLLTALDAWLLLWGIQQGSAAISVMLIFHAVLCLGWLAIFKKRAGESVFFALAPLLVFVLGPVGGVLLAVSYVLFRVFGATSKRTFESWYYELFPETEESDLLAPSKNNVRSEGRIKPFIDVIDHGTLEQKRAVVAAMARGFKPPFAPALKAALTDSEVRGLAATAVAKIEQGFSLRWAELEAYIREHPNDLQHRAILARLLDDYAYLGIFDRDRERELRSKAERALIEVVQMDSSDIHAVVRLGRLYIRQERFNEACGVLKPVVDTGRDTKAVYWYCESLLRLGRIEEMQSLVRRWYPLLEQDDTVPAEFLKAVEFWQEPSSVAPRFECSRAA